MKLIEQIFEFTPPHGDPSLPIKVLGLQDYSPHWQPGQPTVWEFTVPECYRAQIPDGLRCFTYAEVCGTLAHSFLADDSARMQDHMVQWYADYLKKAQARAFA